MQVPFLGPAGVISTPYPALSPYTSGAYSLDPPYKAPGWMTDQATRGLVPVRTRVPPGVSRPLAWRLSKQATSSHPCPWPHHLVGLPSQQLPPVYRLAAHVTSPVSMGSYGIDFCWGWLPAGGLGCLFHIPEDNICGWREQQGFCLSHWRADGLEGNGKKRKTCDSESNLLVAVSAAGMLRFLPDLRGKHSRFSECRWYTCLFPA